MAAGGEPGGICSDAYEAPTSPRPPNFAAESLIAAPLPQTKDSGADSPPLPLTPAHLPPGSPPAIYFTNKGKGGCVSLLASG
ncbi:hypothetical protein CE91St62_06420 [Lachnospiraceae bacterium]|nr:hypothetical protein CE91St61_06470 [Lachnospiraceae bacterium]BDF36581.1 hypothetical protein CE91St62_06420 [Lachnospiraceae bacterium]